MIESIWFGESRLDRALRAGLAPLSILYRGAVTARGLMYDHGMLSVRPSSIPVVSIGNLSVGGTGKTPIAAWIANRLVNSGHKPAVVLRGYGNDEPRVHGMINPAVPVVIAPDRATGIEDALHGGADVAVLDDAFQHRRAARNADIVLLSADSWTGDARLLPAGPYREPVQAIRRATAVIVTQKAATESDVSSVLAAVHETGFRGPVAVAHLSLGELVRATGTRKIEPLSALRNKSVLAIAAIGNRAAFFEQLDQAGAVLTRRSFADHHAFSTSDAAALAREAKACDYALCTLKDAVKLSGLWPAAARPLWYVSLAVTVSKGEAEIDSILTELFNPHGN